MLAKELAETPLSFFLYKKGFYISYECAVIKIS
jgi:hypothetical protein